METEKRKIYVIWHSKENRPGLMMTNYGSWFVFSTLEQAEAYQSQFKDDFGDNKNFFIKEFTLTS